MTTLFETPRLIVRQLNLDDVDNLYAITRDAELMRYVGNNQPLSRELTQKWIDVSINNYQTKGYGCSAVISKADGEFIGYCGLVQSADVKPPQEAELIYALKKSHWGQGLATEVAGAMLAYGFKQCGLKRVVATIDPANTGSVHVVQKLGMTYYKSEADEFGLPTDFYEVVIS